MNYSEVLDRLHKLGLKIEQPTIQKYIREELVDEPYVPRGGKAEFTIQAPLQAYAARLLLGQGQHRAEAIKQAKEIAEYVERLMNDATYTLGIGWLKFDELKTDKEFIKFMLGKSEGALIAWQWAEWKLQAAGMLYNLLIDDKGPKEEIAGYADIFTKLAEKNATVNFLRDNSRHLLKLARGINNV